MCVRVLCFFFFKQKTAYEMRISDWSSDVCSSDLPAGDRVDDGHADHAAAAQLDEEAVQGRRRHRRVHQWMRPRTPRKRGLPCSEARSLSFWIHSRSPQPSATARSSRSIERLASPSTEKETAGVYQITG